MRLGETPVHIPNTMVKTLAADDTMLETAWESRWLPDFLRKSKAKRLLKIKSLLVILSRHLARKRHEQVVLLHGLRMLLVIAGAAKLRSNQLFAVNKPKGFLYRLTAFSSD